MNIQRTQFGQELDQIKSQNFKNQEEHFRRQLDDINDAETNLAVSSSNNKLKGQFRGEAVRPTRYAILKKRFLQISFILIWFTFPDFAVFDGLIEAG